MAGAPTTALGHDNLPACREGCHERPHEANGGILLINPVRRYWQLEREEVSEVLDPGSMRLQVRSHCIEFELISIANFSVTMKHIMRQERDSWRLKLIVFTQIISKIVDANSLLLA